MKAISLVFEIMEALGLDKTGVIKIGEFEAELEKYGLTLDDLEAGLIMYRIIKHILIYKDEVVIDFENMEISYIFAFESIVRLSCEYGGKIHNMIKVVNVSHKYQSFIDVCMTYYKNTIMNTLYTDVNTVEDMAVA